MKSATWQRFTVLVVTLFVLTAGCDFASRLVGADSPAPTPGEARQVEEDFITPESPASPTAPEGPAPQEATPQQPEPQQGAEQQPTEAPTQPPQQEPAGGEEVYAACEEEWCLVDGSFILAHPLEAVTSKTIDTALPFGLYLRERRDSQRGINFLVSSGRPVMASAGGKVVVAEFDNGGPYSTPGYNYGNLVVIKHDLPQVSEPVFTLYAHLSEISVSEGDQVEKGDQIGLVGNTGDVRGSVMHFEVRIGGNSHKEARSPLLWLKAMQSPTGGKLGAIAGTIRDANGEFMNIQNIVFEQLAGSGSGVIDTFYSRTYSGDSLMGRQPWEENFSKALLPPGEYQITFLWNNVFHQMVVDVEAGKLTLVNFKVE